MEVYGVILGGKQSTQRGIEQAGKERARQYLGVDIQHTHPAGSDHAPDGVDTCAIQVALVFTMFQVSPSTDVSLHLRTGHKAVTLAFPF